MQNRKGGRDRRARFRGFNLIRGLKSNTGASAENPRRSWASLKVGYRESAGGLCALPGGIGPVLLLWMPALQRYRTAIWFVFFN